MSENEPPERGSDLIPQLSEDTAEQLQEELKPVLKRLDEGAQRQVMTVVERTIAIHKGPLPSPETFARYEEICPGAADRIIRMAEKQQAHAHEVTTKQIDHPFQAEKLGMWLGLVITVIALVLATVVIVAGHPVAGSIIFGSTLGGIVLAYLNKGRFVEQPPPQPPSKSGRPPAPAPRQRKKR